MFAPENAIHPIGLMLMKPSAAVCCDACVSMLAVPWPHEITELGEDGKAERVHGRAL